MRGTASRKILLLGLVVLTLISLSGCQTMAGWFGLATEQYVDERVTEVQTVVDEKMTGVQTQIGEFAVAADQLEGLIESLEASAQTTEELQKLAVALEERLTDLPAETIKQLAEILTRYLDGR